MGSSICITSVTSALLSGHCTFSIVGTCRCHDWNVLHSIDELKWFVTSQLSAGFEWCVNFTFHHPWHLNDLVIECCVRFNFDRLPLRQHLSQHVHGDVDLCVAKLRHVSLHCLWTVWAVGTCLCGTTGTSITLSMYCFSGISDLRNFDLLDIDFSRGWSGSHSLHFHLDDLVLLHLHGVLDLAWSPD